MLTMIKERKKIILTIALIITLVIMLPVIELLIKMIFSVGNYVGTNIRYIVDGKVC